MPVTMPQAPILTAAVPGNSVTLTWSPPPATAAADHRLQHLPLDRQRSGDPADDARSRHDVHRRDDRRRHHLLLHGHRAQRRRREREGERDVRDAVCAPGDTTPPSKPGTLRALLSGTSQLVLDWTDATDNVGVTGYEVYRDGALVDTVTKSYYLDSGLPSGTSHLYQVRALDAAGNKSPLSSSSPARSRRWPGARRSARSAGVVYNQLGKPLGSVVVKLTLANGTVKSAKTNSGVWKLTSLPVGSYTLTITLLGYQTSTLERYGRARANAARGHHADAVKNTASASGKPDAKKWVLFET